MKFTDLKDAMMSGSAGQIPVNVYQEDGAMAVLMNNTASSPTEPGGNEEAPDVQDPCKDLIELRLKRFGKGTRKKIVRMRSSLTLQEAMKKTENRL